MIIIKNSLKVITIVMDYSQAFVDAIKYTFRVNVN